MSQFALEHPWMTFFLLIFAMIAVDSAVTEVARIFRPPKE
jgi:hypothetical protein